MTLKSPKGLYLHIPFCHARCGYCDFVTFTGKEDRIDSYVQDLCTELKLHAARFPSSSELSTIFFGGGTPSLLEPSHVEVILKTVGTLWPDASLKEITLEANPESVTKEKAAGWRAAGINRISMGLQAYDDRLLKAADRLHSVRDFEVAYGTCRESGFDNMSIDLIYGLPTQSLEDWKVTLEKTLALAPEHLSLYALKVEEHTPFHASGIQVNDDLESDMYEWSRKRLEQEGFEHYEVSNFSRASRACQHNLLYWRLENYIGAGVGAVGYMDGVRWENHKNLKDYENDLVAGRLPQVSQERITAETLKLERIMVGLRLREGMEWEEHDPQILEKRNQLMSKRLLELTPSGRWRVPAESILLTNQSILPFLP